jgi:hypothetical protein
MSEAAAALAGKLPRVAALLEQADEDRPLALERETDPALEQLIGILPRSWHRQSVSSPEDGS